VNGSHVTRRPVTDRDKPFLLGLYAGTREAELAQVPWTAEQKLVFVGMQFDAQIVGYGEAYPQGLHEIISVGDIPAGRIYWCRQADGIHILDITVASASRKNGIASSVLRDILDEADRTGKNVTIYVEAFNPSLAFFERLGFRVASQDGFQLLLERTAASPTNAN
jgi:ribosomal protein S18 acetylase RimI-like enzyme